MNVDNRIIRISNYQSTSDLIYSDLNLVINHDSIICNKYRGKYDEETEKYNIANLFREYRFSKIL